MLGIFGKSGVVLGLYGWVFRLVKGGGIVIFSEPFLEA
jgi:hypothetical protein